MVKLPRLCCNTQALACRENSDALRAEFSKKSTAFTLAVRQRQLEDNLRRRINALHEQTAWDECEAFEGLKASMAGVGAEQRRADEKTGTARALGQQLRDKARREEMERERDAAELAAVLAAQAADNAAAAAREAAAAAERRALSDAIRRYNECALLDYCVCPIFFVPLLVAPALVPCFVAPALLPLLCCPCFVALSGGSGGARGGGGGRRRLVRQHHDQHYHRTWLQGDLQRHRSVKPWLSCGAGRSWRRTA